MADQFHEHTPLMGTKILPEIQEIQEVLGFFKDCLENFCSGWSNTDATDLRPDTLSSDFNVFGGSSNRTGASKIEDYKKAFLL